MNRIAGLLLMALVAGCTNFPCSPSNPCAPGDGGASMRAVGRDMYEYSAPKPQYGYAPQIAPAPAPYYGQPQSTVNCQRVGRNVQCW